MRETEASDPSEPESPSRGTEPAGPLGDTEVNDDAEARGEDDFGVLSTWSPPRGLLTRFAAWALLLLIAVGFLGMAVWAVGQWWR